MKRFKNLVSILLIIALMLTIASCKKEEVVEPEVSMDLTEEETVVTEAEEVVEVVGVEQLATDYFVNLPETVYKIDQKEFVAKVVSGDDMVVLDIRSAEDYGKGHIKGAINVPWGPAIAENLTKVNQDKDVFIYCYTGQTAGQAVATLNVAGINARSVNFGWNLGISKVEGVDKVTETTANTFGTETFEVTTEVQTALDAYYAGLGTITDERFKNYKVSEDDLKAMIDASEDFYLLSVRSAEDYAKEHILGANNVPFNKDLVANLGSVPKDKKVVVYCYSGQTAGQAVAIMRLLGYDAVSLNGGMGVAANAPNGWKNKGYLVESSSPVYNGIVNYFRNIPEHIYKIGQDDFIAKVKAADDMVVLDLRSAEDYGKGHVQGAINMPWGPAIAENLAKINQEKEVFIYCYTGQTAGQAVVTLNLAGINARSVNLGFNMGISKVEGVDDVITMDVAEFGADTFTIDADVQQAMTDYYAGLGTIEDARFKNYKVSEADLAAMIEAKEDFYLLSVRSAEDYAKGHIVGASNVPFGKEQMDNLVGIPKNKKVVVYCYTGQTAGQTVAAMRLMGYDAVSLNGGAGTAANAPMGWTNQGFTLVTE